MKKVNSFENLECWKQARCLTKEIYLLSNEGDLSTDYNTKNQIRRAALSSMNNIAEGFARFSKKEFIRFLDISQSSAAEVKSMLYLLTDLNYVEDEKLTDLHLQIDKTRKLTRGLIKYLRRNIDSSNKNTTTPQY